MPIEGLQKRPTGLRSCLVMAIWMSLHMVSLGAQEREANTAPGRFFLQSGDVVVFTGGANTVASQQFAHLETLFTISSAPTNLHFRSLAWEGDTVYEQRREMNFGSWPEQLKRAGATVVFAQFGQMESLQGGAASLSEFVSAYEKLLDQFARRT